MKNCIKKLMLIALFLLACFLLVYLPLLFYVGKNVYFDNKKNADAILVLGAKSYKDGVYNPCLEARVQHAVNLYKNGFGKKIIMSGGNDSEDNKNEALTMKQIAQGLDVPESKILLESKSTSSYENILFSSNIMKDRGIKSLIIVTEPFHSPRAALVAKKLHVNFSVSPTLTSQCWLRGKYASRYFLREPFALVQYFFQGKL